MRPRPLAALVVAGVAVAAIAVVVALGSSEVRRPEGAAERFLHAISDRNAGQTARWGDGAVASELERLGSTDTPRFSTIEVGRATAGATTARVPARVVANDARAAEQFLTMTARRVAGSPTFWRVVAAEPVTTAATPSTGGARPARAHPFLWLAGSLAVATVGAGADRLVRRMRRSTTVPST